MRRIMAVLMIALPFLIPAVSHAESAEEIMKKFTDHYDVADETVDATMIMVNKQGAERERSLTILSKRYAHDLTHMLIRFTSPQNINGTGILIYENLDRSDDQWLFLPALKKVKKISSSERSHKFVGSEFAYEDLRGEKRRDFSYNLLHTEQLDGHDCFVIEATPKSEGKISETGYSKRIQWIRKDIYFRTKTEYFDKSGKLLKTETDEDLMDVGKGKFRMKKVTMLNNQTGEKTILISNSVKIGTGVPDSKFTLRYLERGP